MLYTFYILIAANSAFCQNSIDSLAHFGLRGNVKSVSNSYFELINDLETIPYASSTYHQKFYTDGILQSQSWKEANGLVVREKLIGKSNDRKIMVKWRSYTPEPITESFSVYEFDSRGRIVKISSTQSATDNETEEFLYRNDMLTERLVYENGKLLSRFVYSYDTNNPNRWNKKTEYDSTGKLVDSKEQVFDDKDRLTLFEAFDAEEGPIEQRHVSYFGDSLITTSVRLNQGNGALVLVGSTAVTLSQGQPVEKRTFNEYGSLTKFKSFQYDDGRIKSETLYNAQNDTLETVVWDYQIERRIIKTVYGRNHVLISREETDYNNLGLRVYSCNWTTEKQKVNHFEYDDHGNAVMVTRQLSNYKEGVSVVLIEQLAIEYYEN